jgi:hypothetical protein
MAPTSKTPQIRKNGKRFRFMGPYYTHKKSGSVSRFLKTYGGAWRGRTADLLHAMQALYQLS